MSKPLDILLVEDNPADVRLTREAFREGKILNNLVVAKDGVEAMDFLHRRGKYAGAARPDLCAPVARVLQELGLRRVMVVSGQTPEGYLDEICTFGPTQVAEFYQEHGFHESTLDPAHFPFAKATLADWKGGDRRENAAIIRRILGGEEIGPRLDAVLANAGAALFIAGAVKSLAAGIDRAREVIGSGKAMAKLRDLAQDQPRPA